MSLTPAFPMIWLTVHSRSRAMRPIATSSATPFHRFFQMWQQVGNSNLKDLFVWVADTAGIGNHNDGFGSPSDNTFQGGLAMGFYNMNTGDAPFFKQMADNYAISDNYHQFVMGGTGANF